MEEKNNSNKIITITLAVIICLAAAVIIYVNLPINEEETSDQGSSGDNTKNDSETILTIIYGDEQKNYSLKDLEENFSPVTGTGRYVKSKLLPDTIQITPDLSEAAWTFTGVAVSTLLDEFENLPSNYNISVISDDDRVTNYTKDNVTGIVNLYNETGIIGTSGAAMILAYKQDNEYISDDGPLRIVFVGSDVITLSNLWAKFVVSIVILDV